MWNRFVLLLIILIYCCNLHSCTSIKRVNASKPIHQLSKENITDLNGTYNNSSKVHGNPSTTLWSYLDHNAKDYSQYKELSVKIFIDTTKQNEVNFSLLSKGEVLDQITRKGKIDRGFYLLKTQTKAKTLVFILVWGISTSSVKLGLSNGNNLILMSKVSGVGMILAFPGFASGGTREYTFSKCNY